MQAKLVAISKVVLILCGLLGGGFLGYFVIGVGLMFLAQDLDVDTWPVFSLLGGVCGAIIGGFIVDSLVNRPRMPGFCQCGYNLTGNISGICPECGTPIPEELRQELARNEPEQTADVRKE